MASTMSSSSSTPSASKVKVLVRVRPFVASESKVRCLKIEQGANVEGTKKEEKNGYFVELKNLSIKTYDTHRYLYVL